MILYFELKLELIYTECNFYFSINITMTALERLCANIIAGKIFKDKPELWEQILRDCWYNVEKIKEEQKRIAYFRASSDYEDYLNSIWLDSYQIRKDEQASTYEYDKEYIGEDVDYSDDDESDLPF